MILLLVYVSYTIFTLVICFMCEPLRYKILLAYIVGTIFGSLSLLFFNLQFAVLSSVFIGLALAVKMCIHR
jgi:hypothetical protein